MWKLLEKKEKSFIKLYNQSIIIFFVGVFIPLYEVRSVFYIICAFSFQCVCAQVRATFHFMCLEHIKMIHLGLHIAYKNMIFDFFLLFAVVSSQTVYQTSHSYMLWKNMLHCKIWNSPSILTSHQFMVMGFVRFWSIET
jgi:hypothetical protein